MIPICFVLWFPNTVLIPPACPDVFAKEANEIVAACMQHRDVCDVPRYRINGAIRVNLRFQ